MPKQMPNAGCNRRPTKPLHELPELTIARLSTYHPGDRCARWELLSSETELRVTVLVATRAEATVCTDQIACLRRVKGAE